MGSVFENGRRHLPQKCRERACALGAFSLPLPVGPILLTSAGVTEPADLGKPWPQPFCPVALSRDQSVGSPCRSLGGEEGAQGILFAWFQAGEVAPGELFLQRLNYSSQGGPYRTGSFA